MADMGKPLRLKDLLELDCDSCSASGFRCYPRRLGESSPMPLSFGRSPSLRRPSKLSHLSRSLSRRLTGLREGFWRRRDEEAATAAVSSGCGCGSEPDTSPSESSDSSRRTSRSHSVTDSDFSSASSTSVNTHAAGGEHEEAMKKRGEAKEEGSSSSWSEADDKEQLSPVAVMDFPCFNDGECSPSLDDSLLSRIQTGRKTHKVRRFGSLDELAPVDLEARLAASLNPDDQDDVPAQQLRCHDDETTSPCPRSSHRVTDAHDEPDPDENELLMLIVDTVSAAMDVVSERLLLDFFVEMKLERRSQDAGLHAPRRKAERLEDGEILAAAKGWLLDGAETERWGLTDVLRGGETVVAEMGRGRRWMQVAEEEREVGAMVARMLSDQLVDEVVRDLSV